jgi:hypothetical protein
MDEEVALDSFPVEADPEMAALLEEAQELDVGVQTSGPTIQDAFQTLYKLSEKNIPFLAMTNVENQTVFESTAGCASVLFLLFAMFIGRNLGDQVNLTDLHRMIVALENPDYKKRRKGVWKNYEKDRIFSNYASVELPRFFAGKSVFFFILWQDVEGVVKYTLEHNGVRYSYLTSIHLVITMVTAAYSQRGYEGVEQLKEIAPTMHRTWIFDAVARNIDTADIVLSQYEEEMQQNACGQLGGAEEEEDEEDEDDEEVNDRSE